MKEEIPYEEGYNYIEHAECTVLGGMLVDEVAVQDAAKLLSTEDFNVSSHRTIYRAMNNLIDEGEKVDIMTVSSELDRMKQIGSIGGRAYLASLSEGLPRRLSIESYVRIVKSAALARNCWRICDKGITRIQDRSEDPRIIMLDIEKQLEAARHDYTEDVTLQDQGEAELESIRRQRVDEEQVFVPSGLDVYDVSQGGYAIKEVTVIGARPGIGKSTLLRQGVVKNCLKANFVHLFTPEMPSGQVIRYMASYMAKVPFRRLRHAKRLDDAQMADVEAAIIDIMAWPLKIEDESPLTLDELIAKARSIKRKQNTKLLGVDYLQKLKYHGKVEHRHIQVTDAMVELTSLCKNENIAGVVLSSITEATGKDRNRPPTKADLRQSGDIQFEANTVILMHREIDAETHQPQPKCSIIIDKARSDQSGIKEVFFNGEYIYFEEAQTYLKGF
jgi:replicative DNA helicase